MPTEDLKIKTHQVQVVSPKQSAKEITADQVTPEVAAQIVKKFILPMFEGRLASKTQPKSTSAKQSLVEDIKLTEALYR